MCAQNFLVGRTTIKMIISESPELGATFGMLSVFVRRLENISRTLECQELPKTRFFAVFSIIFHSFLPVFLGKSDKSHVSWCRFTSTHRMTKIQSAFESLHIREHFKNL